MRRAEVQLAVQREQVIDVLADPVGEAGALTSPFRLG